MLEIGFCGMVTVNEMLLSYVQEIGAIDAVFMLRWLPEEGSAKKVVYVFWRPVGSVRQSTKESVGKDNEEDGITRSFV